MFGITRRSVLCVILVSITGILAADPSQEDDFTYQTYIKPVEKDYATIQNYIKRLHPVGELPTRECKLSELQNSDGILFNFYTREQFFYNVTLTQLVEEIFPIYYHVNKDTKIIVHGWASYVNSEEYQLLVQHYLHTQDVNVIVMDWSVYVKKCSFKSIFADVTTVSGEMLYFLMKELLGEGAKPENFHIVGFGVGAHIAAVAGKMIHPHRIARITGVNPWGVYADYPGYPKLQTGDAYFVDVIYTSDAPVVSKRDPGHMIFYVEGGRNSQPGCSGNDERCSLYKSIYYLRRSIVEPFSYPAKKLNYYVTESRPKYEGEGQLFEPDNYMGEYVDQSPFKYGKYYVKVNPTTNAGFYISASGTY